MSDERWQRARSLFEAALREPTGAREELVTARAGDDAELAAEVRSLLAAHVGAGAFLGETALAARREAAIGGIGDDAAVRERIGPWRLGRELGRGGMGTVYLAERDAGDYAQRAAVKVVSPLAGLAASTTVRARFELERRILASLEHPGIARLLDGGTTDDGCPFFVMEYVEGSDLLSWADGNGLDVPARLQLFLAICDAVAHAHARLVVHRDLKPGNILVGADGRPRLLDFGIGKLLAEGDAPVDATVTMHRFLTPSYASPEQIRGEPTTTATDVHGLGLVLYELLTGLRPFYLRGRATREMESAILEQPPRRPSTVALETSAGPPGESAAPATAEERAARRGTTARRLRRQLRGDLDTIVGKALEKEPAARYASVGELAGDVRRHLNGEPLLARPATTPVRVAKFVRRHRTGVAAAAAVVLLAALLSTIYAVRLRQERDLARRESARAREVTAFLAQLLAGADPNNTRGATLTLRQFLAEAPPRVKGAIADPRVRADVLHVIGEAQWHAGAQKEAIGPLTEALKLRTVELGRHHPDTGRTLTVLGAARGAVGDTLAGQRLLREGIAILEATLGPETPDLVWPLDRLAVLTFEEDIPEAERLAQRALRIHYAAGTPLADRGFLLQHLAVFARGRGDNARGATLYLQSYEVSSKALGAESPIAATALCNAARAFSEMGQSRRALPMQQKAQAIMEKAWGGDNVQLAGCLRAGAEIMVELEQLERAHALADAAYAMDHRLYGDDHMQTMNMVAVQAYVADAEGRLDDAVALYDRFLAFQKDAGATENSGWSYSHLARARQLRARGDLAAAEREARYALALLRKEIEPGQSEYVPALLLVGEISIARGKAPEGRAMIEEAARIARAKLKPEQRDYRLAMAAADRLGAPPAASVN